MIDSMKGKVCIVTGANSGIGRATAVGLAKREATLVMLCRDNACGEEALNDIVSLSGNDSIELMIADLASQNSIRQFVKDFKQKYENLHVLINNAGVNYNRRILTEDGLEMTFAVNTLAPFLLTNLLLDTLQSSAPARVINVASKMQSKKIEFDNLQGEKHFSFMQSYGQSKAALITLTYEFARRFSDKGVTFNCLHPGGVNTKIAKNLKGISGAISRNTMKFFKSPEEGAETSLYLASSPEVEKLSGKFFEDKKETKSKDVTYDESIAKQLWDACIDLSNSNNN
jgi:NAD(P)-dependent dehydrogenase (short-subunit alcohol dehydrogenase family)